MVLSRRQHMVEKKHVTKIPCCIGEFHMLHYQQMLKEYEYYRMLEEIITLYTSIKNTVNSSEQHREGFILHTSLLINISEFNQYTYLCVWLS